MEALLSGNMELIWGLVATVLTVVFGLVGKKYKDKFNKLKTLVITFMEAVEDGTITPEETKELIRQVKEF